MIRATSVAITHALVLRPEPGNAATCARLRALGVPTIAVPLFAVRPVAWRPPSPETYDALLFTSANAARHAGAGLASLAALPVVAVGEATAAAARAIGLRVAVTGTRDAATTLAAAPFGRVLHLAGKHRGALPDVDAITVYESAASAVAPDALRRASGAVALLHSPRAAARFAALIPPQERAAIALAALSASVAAAAEHGWRDVAAAPRPTDQALVALAASMIDRLPKGADKPWS